MASLDREWRVEKLATEGDLLGYSAADLVGMALLPLVHPHDLALILSAFARATSRVSAEQRLRLRHRDGTWREVEVLVTASGAEGPSRFSLTLGSGDRPASSESRLSELEHHLRRIAIEVRAAGVLAGPGDVEGLGGLTLNSGLSGRQQEVVSRLLRGERVPGIAKAMYISQSTVRNHLTAVFRKAGVHSQEALLAQLRRSELATLLPQSEY